MTRLTIADTDPPLGDPNPLGVQWHWAPSDDIDDGATYEPVAGKAIAWSVPWIYQWVSNPYGDRPPMEWDGVRDYDAADFIEVNIGDPLPDGYSLIDVGTADAIVYQMVSGLKPRQPGPGTVAQFIMLDAAIRAS